MIVILQPQEDRKNMSVKIKDEQNGIRLTVKTLTLSLCLSLSLTHINKHTKVCSWLRLHDGIHIYCLMFVEDLLLKTSGTIGVQITPCTDSFVEVPADGSLTLSCTPQTQSMEWRLSLEGTSYLSAKFENGQYVQQNLPFDVNSDPGKISLTINTSNTRNITLVNGTVVCQDLSQSPPSSSNCGLNYVCM